MALLKSYQARETDFRPQVNEPREMGIIATKGTEGPVLRSLLCLLWLFFKKLRNTERVRYRDE
jgi:hypothetical protein